VAAPGSLTVGWHAHLDGAVYGQPLLVGVSVGDGSLKVERDIPAPDGQPRYDQQRPGLTIAAGRVYVAFGGLYGDCGPYRGSVVGIPERGAGAGADTRLVRNKGRLGSWPTSRRRPLPSSSTWTAR
jgi:hypothetical protein